MNSQESAELVRLGRQDQAGRGRELQHPLLPAVPGSCARGCRSGDVGRACSPSPAATSRTGCCYHTDYNWRVLAEEGGELRAVADIGTHWLDLIHADHRLGSRVGLRRPDDRAPGPPAAEGRSGDVQRQRPDSRPPPSRSRSPPRTTAASCCGFRRRPRLPVGLAGHRRAKELPAVRNRRSSGAAGLEQRDAQRVVDRAPRAAQRESDPRPGAGVRRRPALHQLSGRPQRRFSGHLQTVLPGLLRLHSRRRFRRSPPPFPTFADGHREIVLCEAILASHRARAWVESRLTSQKQSLRVVGSTHVVSACRSCGP